jgi:hypothetical protein
LTLPLNLCRGGTALLPPIDPVTNGARDALGLRWLARRDLLARERGRLADHALAGAARQIDVDVIVVIDVGARRQHGAELLTGGGLHVAQKALLFRHALPAILYRNVPAVGEREARDIQRIAEGVLRNMRARIAVHAAAGIGGDLLDLDDAGTEPALCYLADEAVAFNAPV